LDESVLAIQGPPGSGKTYIGGHMIVELARAGKRVGVTAVSHKVITNLLKSVTKHAKDGPAVAVAQKTDADDLPAGIERLDNNGAALDAVEHGKVVGGTAWLWARADIERKLDYLFVDEAGQMSLAMVLAAGRAAKNIVLLGDPQQLEQPQRGAHPEGGEHYWSNDAGKLAPLKADDILIVAPYNAQVSALREAMPQCKIGTVDKFRGQEAAIVIYSLTSSSVEDAPRGLDSC
jgi:hypothetical protein